MIRVRVHLSGTQELFSKLVLIVYKKLTVIISFGTFRKPPSRYLPLDSLIEKGRGEYQRDPQELELNWCKICTGCLRVKFPFSKIVMDISVNIPVANNVLNRHHQCFHNSSFVDEMARHCTALAQI